MEVVLTNPNNGRRWRLRPYSNGLCLMIEKTPLNKVNPKNGKPVKSQWVNCERYPSSWETGVSMLLRMLLMDPEDTETIDPGDLEYVPHELRAAFERKLDEIVTEVSK